MADDLDFAFVFEDDAAVNSTLFADLLEFTAAERSRWDYILMPAQGLEPSGAVVARRGAFSLLQPYAPPLRAIGQVISREAAGTAASDYRAFRSAGRHFFADGLGDKGNASRRHADAGPRRLSRHRGNDGAAPRDGHSPAAASRSDAADLSRTGSGAVSAAYCACRRSFCLTESPAEQAPAAAAWPFGTRPGCMRLAPFRLFPDPAAAEPVCTRIRAIICLLFVTVRKCYVIADCAIRFWKHVYFPAEARPTGRGPPLLFSRKQGKRGKIQSSETSSVVRETADCAGHQAKGRTGCSPGCLFPVKRSVRG